MADNKKLQNAKATKNDEFYTQYNTIADEIGHYRKQLEGQVIYCNCDDPTWSEFWRYFHSNFYSLKLKKLIATHYQENSEPSYAMIYEGGDDFNMNAGDVIEIKGNTTIVNGEEVFYTAGDFRSDDCIKLLREATVVTTNPPFSLFRQYISQLIEYDKKFIILGNQNASTYKEVFPLIKENKVWYGASIHSGGVDFRMPDNYETYSSNVFVKDGHHYINLSGIRWFTNLDVKYRHDGLWHKNGQFNNAIAHCYYEGREDYYASYEDFDAINVESTDEIPIDYSGVMGVPITWLDKYNPVEFELLECHEPCVDIQKVRALGWKEYKSRQKQYNGKLCQKRYHRFFIRNYNPIKKSDDLGY